MNTQFYLYTKLRNNLPEKVKTILQCLNKNEQNFQENCDEDLIAKNNDHPFFNTERWNFIETNFDKTQKEKFLKARGDFKNYNGEIKKFVSWLAPYLDQKRGDLLGISEYDDDTWHEPIFF